MKVLSNMSMSEERVLDHSQVIHCLVNLAVVHDSLNLYFFESTKKNHYHFLTNNITKIIQKENCRKERQ